MKEVVVLLDSIRSAHNVGSIFRTADGAGVSKIYLCGYTPAPVDRFGRVQKEIAKTSLGASETVAWEQVDDAAVSAVITRLKSEGYEVVAVEQTPTAVALHDYIPHKKVAYIFGNEIDGVSKQLLDLADRVVELPMHGIKESLNVSVTAGVVLFR